MKLVYDPDSENKTEEEKVEHTLQGENVHEEIKDQHKKMKDKPFKEKVLYYIGYYKFHALAVIAAIAVIFFMVRSVASQKDYSFCCMMVNSSLLDSELLSESFADYANIDNEKYSCYIDTDSYESTDGSAGQADYATATRFMSLIQIGDLDCAVFDAINFGQDALNFTFTDLREVLSPEDLEKYKDRFYYIDYAYARKYQDMSAEEVMSHMVPDTKENQEKDMLFHTDTSSMEEPVPVGIILTESAFKSKTYSYTTRVPVFGIIANTSRTEESIAYLHFLFDENVDFNSIVKGL